jgi:hypothetical protein
MNYYIAITLPTYCERVHAGWFGEPLNLLTNIFFLVAAILAYGKIKTAESWAQLYLYFLAGMIGVIGIGSAIFHAVPNHTTIIFDAVPIYIFLLAALALLLKCLTTSWKVAIGVCALYVAALILATTFVPADFLNGSFRHVITFTTLVIIFGYTFKKYPDETKRLLGVTLLYAAAIICRAIDNVTCTSQHIGTHFLWHTLNATAAYFAILLLIRLSRVAKFK